MNLDPTDTSSLIPDYPTIFLQTFLWVWTYAMVNEDDMYYHGNYRFHKDLFQSNQIYIIYVHHYSLLWLQWSSWSWFILKCLCQSLCYQSHCQQQTERTDWSAARLQLCCCCVTKLCFLFTGHVTRPGIATGDQMTGN